ncbi:MAG: alkaline phosphatase family protein [Lentimonas sp.]
MLPSNVLLQSNVGSPSDRKLVLIGLDGADWQLIKPLMESGQMPMMQKMVQSGTHGNLSTLKPTLSPMLWNTIATGKRAYQHGIHGFTEVDPITEGIRPVASTSRQSKAIWNILQQSGKRCHAVNWFASHPAEPLNGVSISDLFAANGPAQFGQPWPVAKHAIHPEELSDMFAEFRVFPSEVDSDIVSLFVSDWQARDAAKDKRLGSLMGELAQTFSLQNCFLSVLEDQPWDFATVYFRFTDILAHYFMPFHPPKMEGIDESDFNAYQDVVNSTYRFFDLLLKNIVLKAGPEATIMIVSDHGFISGDRRPNYHKNPFADPEAHHREQGIFCLSGPGIKKENTIYSATLCDITPTILSLYGLPVGQDMDGRVLAEVFTDGQAPALERIDSWESVDGDCGMHKEEVRMDAQDAESLLKQFEALGYIEPISNDKQKAIAQTLQANRWNLTREYLDGHCFNDALLLLEELHHEVPSNHQYTFSLAQTYRNLGLVEEADLTIQELLDVLQEGPELLMLQGNIALDKGQVDEAITLFKKVESYGHHYPNLQMALARALARSHEWSQAKRTFKSILSQEDDNALAHQGIAHCEIRFRNFLEAAESAFKAIELNPKLPLAHFYLGLALERMGMTSQAITAFETVLAYAPSFSAAHRVLLRLLRRSEGNETKLAKHQAFLDGADERNQARHEYLITLRAQVAARAAKREEALWQQPSVEHSALLDLGETNEADEAAVSAEGGPVIIVSGLPRSGTSLMMQLLHAAGVPVLTDALREADESNPEGYLEWEPVKQLKNKPALIAQAQGKAVKVVSLLLGHLPKDRKYKIIFMKRPVVEVANSQHAMIARRVSPEDAQASGYQMEVHLQKHLQGVLSILAQEDAFEVLEVDYPELVDAPEAHLKAVQAFLNVSSQWDLEILTSVIKPNLYRHKHKA